MGNTYRSREVAGLQKEEEDEGFLLHPGPVPPESLWLSCWPRRSLSCLEAPCCAGPRRGAHWSDPAGGLFASLALAQAPMARVPAMSAGTAVFSQGQQA